VLAVDAVIWLAYYFYTNPVAISLPIHNPWVYNKDDHMKGDKRNKRDKDFGIKDKEFWRWWHQQKTKRQR